MFYFNKIQCFSMSYSNSNIPKCHNVFETTPFYLYNHAMFRPILSQFHELLLSLLRISIQLTLFYIQNMHIKFI